MLKKTLNIAVDVDGVVLDFIDGFIPIVKKRLGVSLTHQSIVTHDLHLVLGITFEEVWDMVNETLATKTLPVIPGAREGLEAIGHHQITYVTSRPAEHRQRTLDNLRQYGFQVGDIHFRDYLTKFTQRDGTDVLIEDSLEEALLASRFVPHVILYHQPWNNFTLNIDHRVIGVDNWQQVVEVIKKIEVE